MYKLPEWWGAEKPYKMLDCLIGIKNIPDGSIDLILIDPPYGITGESWDTEPNWKELSPELYRVLKSSGILIIFGTFQSLMNFNLNRDAFAFRTEYIWEKEKSVWTSNNLPIKVHEIIHIYSKGTPAKEHMDMIRLPGEPYLKKQMKSKTRGFGVMDVKNNGGRHPRSVLHFNTAGADGEMGIGIISPKPTKLLEILIRAYSDEGDVVLDTFLGSGSTIWACRRKSRIGLGFEIRKECEPMIMKRWMENTPELDTYV